MCMIQSINIIWISVVTCSTFRKHTKASVYLKMIIIEDAISFFNVLLYMCILVVCMYSEIL